jgi:hypothetical protein
MWRTLLPFRTNHGFHLIGNWRRVCASVLGAEKRTRANRSELPRTPRSCILVATICARARFSSHRTRVPEWGYPQKSHAIPVDCRQVPAPVDRRNKPTGRGRFSSGGLRHKEKFDSRVQLSLERTIRVLPWLPFLGRCALMSVGNVGPFLRVQFYGPRQILSQTFVDCPRIEPRSPDEPDKIRETRIPFRRARARRTAALMQVEAAQ